MKLLQSCTECPGSRRLRPVALVPCLLGTRLPPSPQPAQDCRSGTSGASRPESWHPLSGVTEAVQPSVVTGRPPIAQPSVHSTEGRDPALTVSKGSSQVTWSCWFLTLCRREGGVCLGLICKEQVSSRGGVCAQLPHPPPQGSQPLISAPWLLRQALDQPLKTVPGAWAPRCSRHPVPALEAAWA